MRRVRRCSSSSETARDIAPVLEFMLSAAAVKLPDSTTRAKTRMFCSVSIRTLCWQRRPNCLPAVRRHCCEICRDGLWRGGLIRRRRLHTIGAFAWPFASLREERPTCWRSTLAQGNLLVDERQKGARDGLATDAPIWLHLLKTLAAVASAMGLAMLLQLPQPRVAMTTAVVLMQPLAGMVLAKSVYRFFGTLLGAVAALMLGAVFVQQPEAYMAGLTVWVAVCTSLAMRYRHFRWYGFVLAGYTAALIGIPAVSYPNGLLIASLNRAAEVTIGILCAGAISALVMPLRASTVLTAGLRRRDDDFKACAANLLERSVGRGAFEQRFGAWVDETVALDAQLRYAAYETPAMRTQSRRLVRLNSEFLDACARLHALHQLLKRVQANDGAALINIVSTHLYPLAMLMRSHESLSHEAECAVSLRQF